MDEQDAGIESRPEAPGGAEVSAEAAGTPEGMEAVVAPVGVELRADVEAMVAGERVEAAGVAGGDPAPRDAFAMHGAPTVVADPTQDGEAVMLGVVSVVGPGVEGAEAEGPAAAGIRLELKHPLAIRWMHWINFPVLFTMIWSGLLIYWNDSDNAYLHPHAVYRVGLGPVTVARMFPAWVYTNKLWDLRYHVTEGLGYHFFFMWIFAVNGAAYVTYLWASGEWRLLVPTLKSFRGAVLVTLHDLHLWHGELPVRKFNSAQKIAYTSVIAMGAGSLVTGLAIYKPTEAHWLTTLLGGYEMARWEHFWLALGFCGFFVVHVSQVVLAGWNNFRGMVSGWEIRPADATPYAEEGRDG